MFQITINIATPEAARIAADALDFLADRMSEAAPLDPIKDRPTRRPRGSNRVAGVSPPETQSDPAALYTAMGGTVTDTEQPAVETVTTEQPTPETPPGDTVTPAMLDNAKTAAKAKGGLWFGQWLKDNAPPNTPLSGLSYTQVAKLIADARA